MPKSTMELVGKDPDRAAGRKTVQQVEFSEGARTGHKATTPNQSPQWAVKAGGK